MELQGELRKQDKIAKTAMIGLLHAAARCRHACMLVMFAQDRLKAVSSRRRHGQATTCESRGFMHACVFPFMMRDKKHRRKFLPCLSAALQSTDKLSHSPTRMHKNTTAHTCVCTPVHTWMTTRMHACSCMFALSRDGRCVPMHAERLGFTMPVRCCMKLVAGEHRNRRARVDTPK